MTVSAPLSICGITINDDFTNFLEEGSKICTKFALIPLGPSHRDWLYQVLGKSVQNWTRNTYVTKPLGEFRIRTSPVNWDLIITKVKLGFDKKNYFVYIEKIEYDANYNYVSI